MDTNETVKLPVEVFQALLQALTNEVRKHFPPRKKIAVRQLYGFGRQNEYDSTLPSLKKLIEEHDGIRERTGPAFKVNIKYLYDKSRDAKKAAPHSVITLESYHSWIYLTFLGVPDWNSLVEDLHRREIITASTRDKQLSLLSPRGTLGDGTGHFFCFHYSRLWNGIFLFELTIDYQSIRFDGPDPIYDIVGVSGMSNEEMQPMTSRGTARHSGSNLIIDMKDVRGEGLQHMIFSIQPGPNGVQPNRVFMGGYVGVSRNMDIISGTVCLIRKEDYHGHVPLQVERYLMLDKWQKRIPLNPHGFDLDCIPLDRDQEDLLKDFVGNYRLFWLDVDGERMIESWLSVENNYRFSIRTYLSQNGLYTGRLFVLDQVVCLNSIGLMDAVPGVKLSATFYLDVKYLLRKEIPTFVKGVFLLAGVTNFPKMGFCVLKKASNGFKPEPQIYDVETVKQSEELQKAWEKLRKRQKKLIDRQLPFSDSSEWED